MNETDPLLQDSSSERKFFHFSRVRRQKDVEAKRRIKKRQWMAGKFIVFLIFFIFFIFYIFFKFL